MHADNRRTATNRCAKFNYGVLKIFSFFFVFSLICFQANQNIVANSMMPGVQLVNMRPPNAQAAQTKTVATVSPRVVISNQHMVATRPTNPGVSATLFFLVFLIQLMQN